MSGTLKLACPAGGTVSLAAADTASTITLTLPATNGTLALTSGSTFSNGVYTTGIPALGSPVPTSLGRGDGTHGTRCCGGRNQ